MPRIRSASAWWLTGIALVAAVLIIVSVLLNVLADDRSGDLRPADTPEGTVQRYLVALVDNDVQAALGYIEDEVMANCTSEQLYQPRLLDRDWNFSAKLSRTTEIDDFVLVTVEITETELNPPFGTSQYSFLQTFTVMESDGEWRISEPPWPFGWCPPVRELPATPQIADPPPQQSTNGGGEGPPGTAGVFSWNS